MSIEIINTSKFVELSDFVFSAIIDEDSFNADYNKNSSIIQFTKDSLKKTSKSIIELANSEGLYSHACSIKERVKEF